MDRKPLTPEEQAAFRAALMESLGRQRDEMGPDYPEALINLIDALRDYIKVEITLGKEFLQDGGSQEEFRKGMIETKQMMMLLRKLEDHGIDPTLHNIIQRS